MLIIEIKVYCKVTQNRAIPSTRFHYPKAAESLSSCMTKSYTLIASDVVFLKRFKMR